MDKKKLGREQLALFFQAALHTGGPDKILGFLKRQLVSTVIELDPILCWEDDGGSVVDTATLWTIRQDAPHRLDNIVGRAENSALRKRLDLFQVRLQTKFV